MSEVIKIEAEIDLESLKTIIEDASNLNDNEEVFNKLIEVYRVKKQAEDILDSLKTIEDTVKSTIKSRATELYGPEWEAVKGTNYKITRSSTGAVFNISGKVQKKFKIVKESVDTKAVNEYIKEKGKLPAGLEYNASRGSSIRITVHDNENSQA